MIQLKSIRFFDVFTWRLEVLVNFHPLDISAMVMTLPPFLGGYHFPGKLWRSISRRKAGVRVVFLKTACFNHQVVHSLCKYVTTCYNYNPNYRWNFILLSPWFFRVSTRVAARACNGLQRQANSGWIGRTGSSSWVRNLAHPRWSWWTMEASSCGNLPTWNTHV